MAVRRGWPGGGEEAAGAAAALGAGRAVPGRGPTSLAARLSGKKGAGDRRAQPLRRGEFKHTKEGAKLTALFT